MQFSEIYERNLDKMEAIRDETYGRIMGDKNLVPGRARILMHRAYVTFVTKPVVRDDGKPQWADLVQRAANDH